ncbi:MFS-type transporter SLC18B1-like [Pollicipes pollicipes]|uniref:MFS-type transporter SLC18B1-like n=1 Tax=Pollicipes pollicipes TaxID=41117 RepID=UPI0018856D1D|nr:MFS-type transporter SLC18B1-like [Pollicipes pollicipes]
MTTSDGESVSDRTRLLGRLHDSDYEACAKREPPPDAGPSDATGSSPSFSREQKVLLACLCSGSLMGGCLVALMIPFFPLEARERGVSQTVTGAVFSCFALTQLVVYPLTGRLVPRVGASRSYSLGLALAGVSTVAFGVLPMIGDTRAFIAACFVTRVVEAVAISALNTAALTVVANKFLERTNTAVGITETMTGVGISLGPAIGGGLYQLGGYGLPFYVLGVLMLTCAGLTALLMPSVCKPVRQTGRLWPMLRVLVGSAEVWLCCVMLLTVSMNWTAIDPSIEPYVFVAIGITPAQLGLYFLVATGAFTVFCAAWGRVHDSLHNTYALTTPCLVGAALGLLLLAPSPLLYGLHPSWWLLGVGLTVKEISQGGTFIPLFNKIFKACLAGGLENTVVTQSFVSSVFWTVFSVGNVVGPTAGGMIIDASSFPVMTTALAGWTLLVATASAIQAFRVYFESRSPRCSIAMPNRSE